MPTTISPIIIENIKPSIDTGKYPIKRETGENLRVTARIFRDGHDILVALLKYREKYSEEDWHETEMELINPGLDIWSGEFPLKKNTRYLYTVEAYTDNYNSWLSDTTKKFKAKIDINSELMEGELWLSKAVETIEQNEEREYIKGLLLKLESVKSEERKLKLFSHEEVMTIMKRNSDRSDSALYVPPLEVIGDRERARFAAWYEMFPRSQGKIRGKSATFKDCIKRLPEISEMGFDVVYLPPIHPIGITNRKGPNNTLKVGPDDPGSPYAIGSNEGGHMAVEPGLGTIDDFVEFVKACKKLDMEVALDFAINCSPDHPYVTEHPEWFYKRPDGTIKYAENPPKKYEDIYPTNFMTFEKIREEIWEEMKKILLFWIDKGVTIFRVDNPHTKPIPFWQWLIEDIQKEHPEVIFLSEAFTRPPMMKILGKIGFTQSYTYFTWRNFKHEIVDYFTELTRSEMREYFRGNLFANTPDILAKILQEGGKPAFKMRFVLASTLSSVYGIYNGYELCENRAIEGKEEYLNSEKYEYKVWDWDRPGNIKDYITKINRIRKENPALQQYKNLRFYRADNDNIIFYGKATDDKKNIILVVVNLDPFKSHETDIYMPIKEFRIKPDEIFSVHELITDNKSMCNGEEQYVRLDPQKEPALIYKIEKWVQTEKDFDYYNM